MRFLDRTQVVLLHDAILAATGGAPGVLHPTTIDAALARCRFGPFPWDPDLAYRAALLLRGIVADHPFADGNKRTTWEAAREFAARNGSSLEAAPAERERFIMAIATGHVDLDRATTWLRARIGKVSSTGGAE